MQTSKDAPIRIPSFRALRCLTIVLREGTLSAAARELNITPGAVSRQISSLENDLNEQLLFRHARGISATPAGRKLADRLTIAFDDIQKALAEAQLTGKTQPLTVNALPSLCIHWLMPALAEFQGKHSEADVRIYTAGRRNRFDSEEIDVAISIGPVNDARFVSKPFLIRTFSPVCRPQTRENYGGDDPSILLHAPIFYSELQIDSWNLWCRAAGLPKIDLAKNGVLFENTSLAYQAARESAGFVIGQKLLLRNDLELGSMVMPFDCIAQGEEEYCLVYRRKDADAPRVRIFVDWLLHKALEFPEGANSSGAHKASG